MRACYDLVKKYEFRIPWIYRLSLPKGMDIEHMPNDDTLSNEAVQQPTESLSSAQESMEISAVRINPLRPEDYLYATYQNVLPAGSFCFPPASKKKKKIKYECPVCFNGVWGKPGIHLICGDCQVDYEELG